MKYNNLNLPLLTDVLSVPSVSGNTRQMRRWLRKWLHANDVPYTADHLGNIYAVKSDGSDLPYPTWIAHVDTVHRIDPLLTVHYDWPAPTDRHHDTDAVQRDISRSNPDWITPYVRGFSGGNYSGIGGDDKVGIYLALEAILHLPRVKVCFVIDEETGCNGSAECDMTFFADSSFVFQGDRQGISDITESIMGVDVVSNEFMAAVTPLLLAHGRRWVDGGMTDVWQLKVRALPVCCANFSCGYYNPHRASEYVCLPDVADTLALMLAMAGQLGDAAWPHAYEPKTYKSKYSSGGYYGRSWTYNAKDYRDLPSTTVTDDCDEHEDNFLSGGLSRDSQSYRDWKESEWSYTCTYEEFLDMSGDAGDGEYTDGSCPHCGGVNTSVDACLEGGPTWCHDCWAYVSDSERSKKSVTTYADGLQFDCPF